MSGHRLISALGLLLVGCSQGAGSGPSLSAETAAQTPVLTAGPSPVASTKQVKLQYQLGPFDLPAKASADEMREQPATLRFHVDEPLWITGFEPRLEDGQGNPLPGSLLHFAVVSNLAESNPLCTSKHTGNPFAAATSALKSIALPAGHGYAILPEDTLEAKVILKNPTNERVDGVYFTLALTGEPMQGGKAVVDVAPLLLDSDPCNHAPLAIEPKSFVKKEQRFAVPEPGHLIQAHGLLDRYGVGVELTKEPGPKPIWKAAATLDADHQVIDLPSFEDPAGVALERNDAIVLSVAYDNPQDKWYTDATAAAMIYVARTGVVGATSLAATTAKRAATAGAVQSLLLK